MKIQAVLLPAFCAAISACGGSSSGSSSETPTETKKSTEQLEAFLPAVNPDLSTTSIEGLWLINASADIKFEADANDEEGEFDTSAVQNSQELVLIKQQQDGKYFFHECGLQLDDETHELTLENMKLSMSKEFSDDEYSRVRSMSLDITNSNQLSGSSKFTESNTRSDDSYNDVVNANFAGVKVSDSTSFDNATELEVTLTASLDQSATVTLSDISPAVACIAISDKSLSGTADSKPVSSTSEIVRILSEKRYPEEISFELSQDTIDGKSSPAYSYDSDITSIETHGYPLCNGEDDCVTSKSLSITKSSSTGKLSAKAVATNTNEDTLTAEFSVSVK